MYNDSFIVLRGLPPQLSSKNILNLKTLNTQTPNKLTIKKINIRLVIFEFKKKPLSRFQFYFS